MTRAEIERLLPEIFQRALPADAAGDNALRAFIDAMALLHAPSEAILATVDSIFDPYRAPERFVAYLAGWVDLDQVWTDPTAGYTVDTVPRFPTGAGRLRALIATAAALSRWRGTLKGLLLFLETATGLDGFRVDERIEGVDGRPIPFHMRVHAPAVAAPFEPLIRRIIDIEKPAYVTYELVIGD